MAFSLNQTTVLSAFRSGNLLSAVNSMISPGYGIYYASGQNVGDKPFTPTSFIAVEVTREASITTAPIEKGGYTSYNKVQRPGEVHVTFSFEGWTGFSGSVPNLTNLTLTSRSDVLEALDKMVSSAEIYDIETPDTTYTSYDLIKYDFRIRQDNGVTLLIVTAVFQAVQDIAEVKMSSNVANKSNTTKNETAKGPSKNTEQSTGSTKHATLFDVKKALTGLKESIFSATAKVADSVSSGFTSAMEIVTGPLNSAVVSSADQLSKAVKELSGKLT
ncbi:hypothetical protein AM629_15150 [Photorhabdus heterorhabditis]|uniref:Dit-like phage tail protein N-terminal domain-containing protein n=1 Tax=Photorhabdus heterorhabditis TaxID=880156 RepID=A0ABR5K9R8_9GAMM|nr:hypothetical protein [Photorhabdus heterorhabditis]KOY61207.1 hypothetical protein AM629_15150 [Photorhabdus heterorhabditis]